MKKMITLASITWIFASSLMAAGNAAGTTTARLDGLGLNNTQVEDFSNIFANPSLLVNYANIAYMESINQASTGFGGTSYKIGSGVAAVFFNRTTTRAGSAESTLFNQNIVTGFNVNNDAVNTQTFTGTTNISSVNQNIINDARPQNSIDIFYARPLTKSMDLGLRVSYASRATSSTALDTSLTTSQDVSELEFEAGVNLKKMNIDIAASYAQISLESIDAATTTPFMSDGSSTLSLSVRQKKSLGKKSSLITVLSYRIDTFSFISEQSPTVLETRSDITTEISASSTLKYKAAKDMTAYASIGVKSLDYSDEFNNGVAPIIDLDIIEMTLVPVVAGVEAKTSKKWTFRGSISSYLYATATQRLSSENAGTILAGSTQSDLSGATSTVNLNAGGSYHTGGFTLDGVLSSGTYFTGKNNVLDSFLGKFTVRYAF